ncbi:MAG: hypothetical protein IJR13_03495 [Bacteroidales bacterium]|nr:hypothetical protein [Bacteroidales bacterium]
MIALLTFVFLVAGLSSCTKESDTPYYNFADSIAKYQYLQIHPYYNFADSIAKYTKMSDTVASNVKVLGTWKQTDNNGYVNVLVFYKDNTFMGTRTESYEIKSFSGQFKMMTDVFGFMQLTESDESGSYFFVEGDKLWTEWRIYTRQ